ncbi:MAG: type II toxin-antitoxin system HigB family toxin, partial [Methyloprofundus sp.]|nr:type II toxin-antitoxin system HigB family toxin [Methyloprofundus sp.]
MHIITRKRLIEFSKKHPNTLTSLDTWYRIVKQNELPNFSTLRQIFPSADKVDNLTV